MMLQELFREMESYAEANHVPILRPAERERFSRLARESRARHMLEVGTAIGYSTLLLARESLTDTRITTIEQSEERAECAKAFFKRSPYADRIDLRVGDAGAVLMDLDGKYDFVFLDAAKGQYVDYLKKLLPLLAPQGVMLADNVLFRGYVLGNVPVPRRFRTIAKRLREYLRLVQMHPGFETEFFEEGDGLAVTRWILEGASC